MKKIISYVAIALLLIGIGYTLATPETFSSESNPTIYEKLVENGDTVWKNNWIGEEVVFTGYDGDSFTFAVKYVSGHQGWGHGIFVFNTHIHRMAGFTYGDKHFWIEENDLDTDHHTEILVKWEDL